MHKWILIKFLTCLEVPKDVIAFSKNMMEREWIFIKNNFVMLLPLGLISSYFVYILDAIFSATLLVILLTLILILGLLIATLENSSSKVWIKVKNVLSKQKNIISTSSSNLISTFSMTWNIGLCFLFICSVCSGVNAKEIIRCAALFLFSNLIISFLYFSIILVHNWTQIWSSVNLWDSKFKLMQWLKAREYRKIIFLSVISLCFTSFLIYIVWVDIKEANQKVQILKVYSDCQRETPKKPENCSKTINELIQGLKV